MNELSVTIGTVNSQMTVKEVAEALNLDVSTVQKRVRELFPDIIRNGIPTYLSESQVFVVKKALQSNGHLGQSSEVFEATTALEIAEMTLKVIEYHKAEADRLRSELAIVAPKVEGFDALMRSERAMSITDCAKHFGLHPKLEVFPYLRARGYLTRTDLPTQAAIDSGYLSLKETVAQDGRVWPQAVVEAWQLENWRAHVIHQIKAWLHNQASA